MKLVEGKRFIIALLKKNSKAKNSEMLQVLNGDEELLNLVREDLIFNDLAEDKKGVGLIYLSPTSTPQNEPTSLFSNEDNGDVFPRRNINERKPSELIRESNRETPKNEMNTREREPFTRDRSSVQSRSKEIEHVEPSFRKRDNQSRQQEDDKDMPPRRSRHRTPDNDDTVKQDNPFRDEMQRNRRSEPNTVVRKRTLSGEDADNLFEERKKETRHPTPDLPWNIEQISNSSETLFKKINLTYDTKEIQLHTLVFRLQRDLGQKGYRVWLNKQQLEGDETLVPLLTPSAVRRPNGANLDDIILARSNHFQILPLLITPYRPPLNIFRWGCIDLQDWENPTTYQQALTLLTNAIESTSIVPSINDALFSFLNPLDFGAESSSLALDFTGREWFYEEFDDWVADDTSRVFLINGNLGVGKSAIIAQLAIKHPLSGAYFFCRNQWSATIDAAHLILTFAAQLVTQLPEFRISLMESAIYRDWTLDKGNLLTETPIDTLFHALLLEPISKIKSEHPLLLYIDDLHLAAIQTSTERNMIRFLKDAIHRFPPWIKFVFSATKGSDIADVFKMYQPYECDLSRDENYVDINTFLENNFNVFPLNTILADKKIEAKQIVSMIIKRSTGNFLHAKQIVAAMLWGQIILEKPETMPNSLYDIYNGYFERTFPQDSFDQMRKILEILLASRQPLTALQISFFLGIEPQVVEQQLIKAIFFFPIRDGTYQVVHPSITDWLVGRVNKTHLYLISLIVGHRHISEKIIPLLHDSNADEYALNNITHHLVGSLEYQQFIQLMNDYGYIRLKITSGLTRNLMDDFAFIIKFLANNSLKNHTEEWLIQWFKIIQATLSIAERVISQDHSQLASELTSRLIVFGQGGLFEKYPQKFLEEIQQKHAQPWLRPLLPTLIPPGGTLVNVLRGHQGKITTTLLTPDGKKVITGSEDYSVRVWDLERGTQLYILNKHTKKVNALAITTDNTKLLSASNDKYIHVWDLIQGKCLTTLTGHTSYVNAIAISPTGNHAVSASSDNTIKIWDIATPFSNLNTNEGMRLINTLYGHTDSVDKVLITPDGRRIVSTSNDKTIRIWDLTSGEQLFILRGHQSIINILCITSDNRYIISSSIEDYAVKIWDLENGRLVSTVRGHSNYISAFTSTPDSKWIVTGSGDKTIKIWMIPPSLGHSQEFQAIELFTLKGHINYIRSLVVIPERKLLISAAADKMIKIWHFETGKEIRTLQSAAEGYNAVFVSLDHRRIISTALDNTIKLWDISYGVDACINKDIQLNFEPAHTDDINNIVLSSDARRAVSASSDGRLKVWNISASYSAGSASIYLPGAETQLGREICVFNNHTSAVHCAAITPDSQKCVSAGYGIRIWMLEDGTEISAFKHPEWIFAIAVTPDGKWVVSGSSEHTLKVWELESGRLLGSFGDFRDPSSWVRAIVITPDGRKVISAGLDKTIKIWDLRSGRELGILKAHQEQINALIISPDGKTLYSASHDKTIKIWQTDTWQESLTIQGHLAPVRAIALATLKGRLVSVSDDGTVIIWDVNNGNLLVKTNTDSKLYTAAITNNAEFVVTGGFSGRINFYHCENL